MAKDYFVHIVAVDENNGIGYDDKLLFRIKEDLEQFKNLTIGCKCIAGTKTLSTLPELPNRQVFRLSRKPTTNVTDITKLKDLIIYASGNPIFIIGGGEVYKETLKGVSVIMLTRIHAKAEKVDTWYPDFLSERRPKYCTESSRHTDEKTGLEYSFHIYGYDKEDLKNFLRHKAKRGKDAAAKNTEKSLASQSRVPSTR